MILEMALALTALIIPSAAVRGKTGRTVRRTAPRIARSGAASGDMPPVRRAVAVCDNHGRKG